MLSEIILTFLLSSWVTIFNQMLAGDLWGALWEPYLELMGEWFYALLAFFVLIVTGVKTESPAILGMVTIALFMVSVTVMPVEFHRVGYFTVAMGLTFTIAKAFLGRINR